MKVLVDKMQCRCGNETFYMECVTDDGQCGINLCCTACEIAYCSWDVTKEFLLSVERGMIEQELELLTQN